MPKNMLNFNWTNISQVAMGIALQANAPLCIVMIIQCLELTIIDGVDMDGVENMFAGGFRLSQHTATIACCSYIGEL